MKASYVVRRVIFLFMVIWTAASLNFILPHLTGRDPIREQLEQQIASQGRPAKDAAAMIATYNRLFGLDKPLWEQYLVYIKNVFRLDFGFSMMEYPRTVMEIIIARGKITLPFVAVGIVIAFIVGILLGALMGWSRSPAWISAIAIPPLMAASSIPQFVIALLLIFFFAFKIRLFPLGYPYPLDMTENWGDPQFLLQYAYHAVLPIMTIVIVEASGWALGMRAMMVTVEGEDYTVFAEAKGLKPSRIFLRYMLRNALLPSLTGLALRIGFVITGAAVAEAYFNYNGLGARLGAAIASFDYFVIYGIATIIVICIASATFIMDMIYPLLDPRISYRAQKG
ncbi:MAG TPA: ABC transporter permease [Anaerolineaceae bacterium]|jgi:peptide/nickel transport system permease protein